LAVVWEDLFEFSMEAFEVIEVLEVDGLVDEMYSANSGGRVESCRLWANR